MIKIDKYCEFNEMCRDEKSIKFYSSFIEPKLFLLCHEIWEIIVKGQVQRENKGSNLRFGPTEVENMKLDR